MERENGGTASKPQPTYEELRERVARLERQAQQEISFRRVLDNLVEGCAVLSPAWIYLYVNDVNARHAHLTPAEMVGRNMLELIPGVEESPFFAVYRRCMEERTPQRVESKFTFADGSSAWYEAKAEPVSEGIFVLSQDITARKTAEEELRKALGEAEEGRRTLQALMDHVPEGITIADEQGVTIRMVSRFGQELLGSPHDQLPAAEVARRWTVYHPDGKTVMAPDDLPLTRAVRRGEVVRDAELVQVNAQGQRLHLLCNAAPIHDGRGRIVGAVVAWRDISDRKQAEEALRESERRYRAIGESIDYGVWVCAPDGKNIYASESFLRLVGLTQQQCSDFGWGDVLHPDDAERTIAAWKECVRTGGAWDIEHRFRGVDGKWHPILARGVPVRNERGEITSWAGINLDIGRLKEAEEALREADRRKDEFLAVLSHELRNPLTPIRNSVFMLEHAPPGGEQARRAHQIIDRQSAHLARLVDDLLDLNRINRGKVELHRERFDLAELVQRTIEDHRASFLDRGVGLDLTIAGAPLWLEADPTRIAQVVGNLLGNAGKFTPRGGSVHVAVHGDASQAVLRVRDTGAGIAPDLLRTIFEPFTQAEQSIARSLGGLGLGLALVKGFVEMHGGAVSAASAGPGRGAEFVVRLPLLERVVLDESRAAVAAAPRTLGVLVIEDNRDAAESLRGVLELLGHEAQLASDGTAGIAAARAMRPDLVLCDIGLPDMSGYAVARELRADPQLAACRLVALTGYAQPEDLVKAREAGFDRHLAKPPSLDRLRELLSGLEGPSPER
jgi:PAS domain S-box-containing protein